MLAIVLPYYKLIFFESTLKSLANQTDKRFKVYIGDDTSPENPVDLLKKYKEKFDFVYHRFENNLGAISLTQQWERCIDLTENEDWLMILGDDDALEPNVVKEFYANLEEIKKQNIKVIRYASQIIDENGTSISEKFEHPKLEKAAQSYFKHFSGQTRSSLSEYIFSRSSYDCFGFTNYPLAWHSDDKAWLDFSECGFLFSINKALIKVRITNQSISGQNKNRKIKRFSRMKFLENLIDEYFSFFTRSQKRLFLLEFGILIKELNLLDSKKVARIFILLLKMGFFYDAGRFLRRIYIVKS